MEKNQKKGHIAIFSVSLGLVGVIFLGVYRISLVPDSYRYSIFDLDPFFWLLGIGTTIVGFLLALVAAAIGNKAETAGRSWISFFWLSALVSPIVMGIIAATLAPNQKPNASEESKLQSQILELKSLRDNEIITDEEYAAATKKALNI